MWRKRDAAVSVCWWGPPGQPQWWQQWPELCAPQQPPPAVRHMASQSRRDGSGLQMRVCLKAAHAWRLCRKLAVRWAQATSCAHGCRPHLHRRRLGLGVGADQPVGPCSGSTSAAGRVGPCAVHLWSSPLQVSGASVTNISIAMLGNCSDSAVEVHHTYTGSASTSGVPQHLSCWRYIPLPHSVWFTLQCGLSCFSPASHLPRGCPQVNLSGVHQPVQRAGAQRSSVPRSGRLPMHLL